MYAISPQKYKQLLPYITIDNNNQYKSNGFTKSAYVKKELQIIEVNTADTLLLDEIKGVGAAFARRIVKYRDRLGGFYKKEQLLEVYGVDSIKFAEIKDQIRIDVTAIKKININAAEFQDLKSNPYLNYKQINAIIQYRKQHGNYNDINDLRKILILNAQIIQNLTPYLSF
jgi:competence ComEA-like helix-hairpin-helix protein